MDMNDQGPIARDGIEVLGGAESSTIYGYGVILKDSGDILVRVRGTKFQKFNGTTWTDVATVTAKKPFMISYQCSDRTEAAVLTGT